MLRLVAALNHRHRDVARLDAPASGEDETYRVEYDRRPVPDDDGW